jgi:hypothetical protein
MRERRASGDCPWICRAAGSRRLGADSELGAAGGVTAGAELSGGLDRHAVDALVDDFRLEVFGGDDGRSEEFGVPNSVVSAFTGSPLSRLTATSAAAPPTISLGLEIVLY